MLSAVCVDRSAVKIWVDRDTTENPANNKYYIHMQDKELNKIIITISRAQILELRDALNTKDTII